MLSRLLLVLLALTLVSGCTSPSVPVTAPADVAQAVAPVPDNSTETIEAFRVVPRITVLDWTESIHPEPCQPDGGKCEAPVVGVQNPWVSSRAQVGLTWNRPQRTITDDDAVFWRVAARGNWSTQNSLVTGVRVSLLAVAPCGTSCVVEREVWSDEFSGRIVLERTDVFLEDGETGVRLAVEPLADQPVWGVQDVRFHLDGLVAGFVQDGPVIHLTESTPQ